MRVNLRHFFTLLLSLPVFHFNLCAQGKVITDYPFYTTFDIIHYAAFTGRPSVQFYVAEVIDSRGKAWIQQKIKADNGRISGTMHPDNHMPTGIYWIRIYPSGYDELNDGVMYFPVVIVNADDLEEDRWRKSLVGITGKVTVHFLQDNRSTGNSDDEIRLAMIDESGKIIPGAGQVRNEVTGERKEIKNDSGGIFNLSLPGISGQAYTVKLGTSAGDTLVLKLDPENGLKGDLVYSRNAEPEKSPGKLQLTTGKKEYDPGERVVLNVTPDRGADLPADSILVVSVNRINQPEITFNPANTLLLRQNSGASTVSANKEIPVTGDGLYLTGSYINPVTGRPRINYTVAAIELGSKPEIAFTQVDRKGNFIFDASSWPENNTVYLSTIGQSADGLEYSDNYFRKFDEVPVVYFDRSNAALLDSFVTESAIRRVLTTQYYKRKQREAVASEQLLVDTTRVYPAPDLSYILNDYIQFNDVTEVIRNILINVHLIESRKGSRLFIYNNQNPYLNRHPVILINGIPTRDIPLLLGLNINDIHRVDLLYKQSSLRPFGIAGFGGIMAVYTSQNVDVPNSMKISFHGLHEQTGEYIPESQEGIPDLSPVVYWNPEFKMTPGPGTIGIRLNDLLSDLKVSITGFDRNGKILKATGIIKIKQD